MFSFGCAVALVISWLDEPVQQAPAARAPLGWSQGYLAQGIGVSRPTIADLEARKREPHSATLFVLMNELAAAGIVFTERGVGFRKWPAPALRADWN